MPKTKVTELKVGLVGDSRRVGLWSRAIRSLTPDGLPFAYHLDVPAPDKDSNHEPIEVISDPEVNAVVLSINSRSMENLAGAALEARKPILMDGPLSDLDSTSRLLQKAQSSRIPIFLCNTERFYPPYQHAAGLLKEKAVGLLSQVRIKSHRGGYGGWGQSLAAQGADNTALERVRSLWSLIDLASWWLGPVEMIYAGTLAMDHWDRSGAALIKFKEPGRQGVIEFAASPEMEIRTLTEPVDHRIEITGSKGYIWLNHKGGETVSEPVLAVYRGSELNCRGQIPQEPFLAYVNALQFFLDSLEKGPSAFDNYNREGIMGFRVYDAAVKSSESRHPIKI